MDVLVYSGPEVLPSSLAHCINTLRSLLVPNYAVQALPHQPLVSQPWSANCALLVLPTCRGFLPSLPFRSAVSAFIESGGALLVIGASVSTPRPVIPAVSLEDRLAHLRLYDGKSMRLLDKVSGSMFDVSLRGWSEDSLRSVTVEATGAQPIRGIIAPADFGKLDVDTTGDSAEVIARYVDAGDETNLAAAILCYVGKGSAVFWNSLIDQPLTEEPAVTILSQAEPPLSQDKISATERGRQDLLRMTLQRLGLVLPKKKLTVLSPLPQFLISTPSKPWIVERVMQELSIHSLEEPHILKDNADTFEFRDASKDSDLPDSAREAAAKNVKLDASVLQPKIVLLGKDGTIPSVEQTPLFDIRNFYEELVVARRENHCLECAEPWGMGEALLYGEVVTSTQSMLDKNLRLLSSLPSPLVSVASHQLAGRGRGANVWLSSGGSLLFSLLLRVSLSDVPAARLVFVQYLFALAVAEACRDPAVLGDAGRHVRLKWPNDVYALREDGVRKKMGGVLVNTSFSSGQVEVVIGCGLNVWNSPPIQSLLHLVSPESRTQLTMERTLATILARFESMWNTFVAHNGSFEPFLDLYYERWMHSDQLVELTTTMPHQKVRIVGITSDHGLLRTMPERGGWWNSGGSSFIDLQPDGNSFDLMAGLIKAKR
ncbi:class II aaRS and biotin synthetase [Laetiporus sulphureus 93-53]|uniref:Class II aaRS and biotin synthetase n=1 Tax=Laetiporus sulphureus 93-53 TaxID=1314785 RepID=A0A165BNC0_9APHY|nr:class II aaRS and biotin synthetase [Laetiporus sulphureus 93-53]KZT01356.1 class II aaRS and biotin synthetase [Laetiporus sulphureus 93-53]